MKKELWISTDNKELEKDAKFMNVALVSGNEVELNGEKFTITTDENDSDKKKIFGIEVKGKEDENRAVKFGGRFPYTIVTCSDWKVIPLENIIANLRGKTKIVAKVRTAEEAELAFGALELGVAGVLLETNSAKELAKMHKVLQEMEGEALTLEEATIVKIKALGLGARTCLDTSDLMKRGEGALVGSSSGGMFLIQAEVEESPFVSPRPFRVNAGALSLYTLVPGNKTSYLEEIEAGDEILIVNRDGKARPSFVCRSKIELRPLILVEAKRGNKVAKAILQNAETVRLVTREGSTSINDLKEGDKVLAHFEEGGRHFGTLVKEEQVIEK